MVTSGSECCLAVLSSPVPLILHRVQCQMPAPPTHTHWHALQSILDPIPGVHPVPQSPQACQPGVAPLAPLCCTHCLPPFLPSFRLNSRFSSLSLVLVRLLRPFFHHTYFPPEVLLAPSGRWLGLDSSCVACWCLGRVRGGCRGGVRLLCMTASLG